MHLRVAIALSLCHFDRCLTREALPPLQRHLYVPRLELDSETTAAGFLRGNHRRAAAEERVEDEVAAARVVEQRDLEQSHRLLRAVTGRLILARAIATKGVQIRHLPHRRLRA